MSDATRVRSAGPEDRLACVYVRYHRRLLGYVTARLGRYDFHLAEDLTSEVFLRVVVSLPQCQVPEPRMFSWLAAIARRAIADHYRSARRERPVGLTAARAYQLPPVRSVEDAVLGCAEVCEQPGAVAA